MLTNFLADGPGSYAGQEGQTYTDDELERIYELLSQEAENPVVRRLFDGAEIMACELPELD